MSSKTKYNQAIQFKSIFILINYGLMIFTIVYYFTVMINFKRTGRADYGRKET